MKNSKLLLTAVLALFSIIAFAAGPKGFEAGKKPFANPFAGARGGDDRNQPQGRAEGDRRPERAGRASAFRGGDDSGTTIKLPGTKKVRDVPDPRNTPDGISVGGGKPSGVVEEEKPDPFRVDSITGAGSNAVVTDFNYPDADILDIAKTIGKLTGKNFIFDKNVKGRISIVSNQPITVSDAWKAFLTALDVNGFTLVPSGEFIRIARQRDARDKQLDTYTGDFTPNSDALITRVFPLKHISADEVARTFRSFMPANARIIPYAQTNTVIVTDTGSNITKLSKMLGFLDIEGYDAGIEVIPVKFASAVELAKLIDTLLPGTGSSRSTRKRSSRLKKGSFSSRRTKEGGLINTIIADERTNSLIVHANANGVMQVKKLVVKLDKKTPAPTGGGKIHVIYLQFSDAKKIAQTINNLSSKSSSGGSKKRGKKSNPIQAGLFEGAIRVAADEDTNSLVVTASPADFVTVQRVVSRLDIPRDEVYVEAIIMEMTLARDFQYSVNFALPSKGIALTPNTDLIDFVTNPLSQKGFVLGLDKGAKQTFQVGGNAVEVGSILGLIKAIQTNSNANILATPQIMTLDNTEATFEAGERIPVPTSTANQTAVTTSVTKESIGLSIKLKPQINKSTNFVKLEIETKLEDISRRELPSQVSSLAFATIERKAKTTVVVADGDTVVIGGMIRDKESEAVSKIPLLGDIPILGWLFRSSDTAVEKTNLLIFLTPSIIRHYERVRAILDQKLKDRDKFIEKEAGGDDPMRSHRDDMIRRLPDIDDVISNALDAQTSMSDSRAEKKSPFTGKEVEDGEESDGEEAEGQEEDELNTSEAETVEEGDEEV